MESDLNIDFALYPIMNYWRKSINGKSQLNCPNHRVQSQVVTLRETCCICRPCQSANQNNKKTAVVKYLIKEDTGHHLRW